MTARGPLAAAAFLLAGAASGAELELAGYAGPFIPSYEQHFRYSLDGFVPAAGTRLGQAGTFGLDARGGLAAGAAATLYFAGPLGLEGRLDTGELDVQSVASRVTVVLDLPAPLPDVTSDVSLGLGQVEADRLHPLSLNLKLRTPGPVRLFVSGGASYLPEVHLRAAQPIGIGLPRGVQLDVTTVTLEARVASENDSGGRLGINGGVGLQLGLGSHVALVAEGRAFLFRKHTLVWTRADNPVLAPLQEAVLREIEKSLQPIEFNPTFYQMTGGLAFTF